MRKIVDRFYLTCGFLASFCMLGLAVIIIAQIGVRLMGANIPSSDDISGYLVAGATFFGLAYTMNSGEHIRIDLFINMLSPAIRRIVLIITKFFGFILISTFFYYVMLMVKEAFDYGDLTSGQVAFPMWLVQMPYAIGVFALLVSVLDQLILSILDKAKVK